MIYFLISILTCVCVYNFLGLRAINLIGDKLLKGFCHQQVRVDEIEKNFKEENEKIK